MIIALLIGIVTGFLFSFPPGPVNATAISRTVHHAPKYGYAVGFGAAFMDFIYCGGAGQIHEFLVGSPIINLLFQSAGFILLLWLGISFLKATKSPSMQKNDLKAQKQELSAEHKIERLHVPQSGLVGAFMIGVVLYVSNVAGVPEWIFVSAFWRNTGLLHEGVSVNAAYALGASLGAALWFFLLVRFLGKRIHSMKAQTVALINRISAVAMLCFGLYFGYQIVFKTEWNKVNDRWQNAVGHSSNDTITN